MEAVGGPSSSGSLAHHSVNPRSPQCWSVSCWSFSGQPCLRISISVADPCWTPSQSDPYPPPGAPHSTSSASLHSDRPLSSSVWAGPHPEGLHQRSCSVSSADQWSEVAALPPGVQLPGEWCSASSGSWLNSREEGSPVAPWPPLAWEVVMDQGVGPSRACCRCGTGTSYL